MQASQVASMGSATEAADSTRWSVRIGAAGGIAGSILAMVANLLHPIIPTGDPAGVARTIADSQIWVIDHLGIVVGLILMLGGLVAVGGSITVGLPGALARLGQIAAVSGVTVGVVLVTLDGVAAKHLADAWATAPAEEQAVAVRVLMAEETMNFALAALFNILFAGVTFVLYGLAVTRSGLFPRWLGWVAVVAGIGSVVVGFVQASTGESTGFTRIMTIVFPTIITLWVLEMSVMVLRRPRPGD